MRTVLISILVLFLTLTGFVSFIACDSGGGSGGSGDDDNDNDEDDDDDNDDDDEDDDDEDDDDNEDDDDEEEPDTWGGVYASEGWSSSNVLGLDYYCGASAAFYDPEEYEGYGDPDDEEGDCKLYYYNGGSATDLYLNAGKVTVTGTKAGTIYLNPKPWQGGYIYEANIDFTKVNDLFGAGDEIRAQVAGGSGIDSADMTVQAPTMISVTKPSNFDSLSSLPKSSMTFEWAAGNAEKVFVAISTFTSGNGVVIQCEAPDDQGQIVVHGDLMKKLQSNPQSMSVTITRSKHVIGGGDRPVQLGASTYRQRSYFIY